MNRARCVAQICKVRYTVWPIKKARFAISCVTSSTTSGGINFLIALLHPWRVRLWIFYQSSSSGSIQYNKVARRPILRIIRKYRKHKVVALLNQFWILQSYTIAVCVKEKGGGNAFSMGYIILVHIIYIYISLVYLFERCKR